MSREFSLQYYVERPSAEQLQAKLSEALQEPQNSYLVFHIWGIGGVGKTTLTSKLKQKFQEETEFIEVSFGMTADIDTPIKLMEKFHQQFTKLPQANIFLKDLLQKDSFQQLLQNYKDGINQLKTQPIDKKDKEVTPEQLNTVKNLVSQSAKLWVKNFAPASSITEPIAGKAGEAIIDVANLALSEKDRIVQLLQQHQATKKDKLYPKDKSL